MGSAPRFPISALTLVEKHIPYTVYSIPNFPQKQNPNLRKTAPNKPRFHLPHILRILRSGNFCVVTPLALPKNKLHENKLRFVTAPPSVSAQALCFSVLDAVFGMTLEFGKPSCRLGAMWGGLCRLLDVGIIRV